MTDVRRLAFDVLYRVLYEDAYSAIALNNCIKGNGLSALDAGFLSALVYGVLERKLTLDYIIRRRSSVRLTKIETKTLIILYLGLYQLIYMDKVPDSAAVNESVKLAKALKLFKSSGYINGLLRSFIRDGKSFDYPDPSDRVRYLSVRYSCPEWIVRMWLNSYGDELTERMLEGLLGRPDLTVRVNTLKTTVSDLTASLEREGVTAEAVPFLSNALYLSGTGSLENLTAFKRGEFYVEDASSQLCAEMLGACEGETVCDVCAAPGGKSFFCAIRMNDRGEVCSYDLHEHKLRLIREGADRLGVSSVKAERRDAADTSSELPESQRVLCDVPCSGLGILRRKPEIRYKTDTNIDLLPDLQYSILCNSAYALTSGGVLMYSTCTLNGRENIDIAERFLAEHPDFESYDLELPEGFVRYVDEPRYCLTVLPGVNRADGFFMARFRKAASE